MNRTVKEYQFPSGQVLQIAQGDITDEHVDAIVNAANSHLVHGAGVAGAILRRGGQQIQDESNRWVREHGPVSHAEPAYTSAGKLPCRYVIHAVGPVWGESNGQENLDAAIRGALKLAEKLGIESIALPAISTGVFGFPKLCAAEVILYAIGEHLTGNPASGLKLVRVVLFDDETLQAFMKAWDQDAHFRS